MSARHLHWLALSLVAATAALWLVRCRSASDCDAGESQPPPTLRLPIHALEAAAGADHTRGSTRAPSPELATAIPTSPSIRVVDAGGVPVAGARVHAISSDATELVGTSAADGSVRGTLPGGRELTLVARADGYRTAQVDAFEPPEPSSSAITLVLRPGARISGVVSSQAPVPSPVDRAFVLAWPADVRIPDAFLARRALAGDPRCACARTDAAGRFEIDGLDPSVAHALVAGARGLGMSRAIEVASGGDQHVALSLEALYGTGVRIVDSTGAQIELPAGLLPPAAEPLDVAAVSAAYAFQPSFVEELAGLAPSPWPNLPRGEYYFTASGDHERIGPLTYRASLPGFEPVEIELWAERLDSQSVTVHDVVLTRTTLATGSIGVFFDGLSPQVQVALRRVGGIGVVRLVDGREDVRRFRVEDFSRPSVLLADLPLGVHRIGASFHSSPFRFPPGGYPEATVEVGPTPGEWVVDASAAGAVELELTRWDGSPYRGPASALVRLEEGSAGKRGEGGPALFDGAPHLIVPLAEGRYRIRLLYPAAESGEPFLLADVTAGSITKMEIRTRE